MASKNFFLVQFMMIISILQSCANSNTSDLTALLDFKNRITEDPLGIMLSWNDSIHHCKWRGITCDPNKRVQTLNLMSQKLVGTLPPSLGNLSFLTGINLRFNAFNGEIPPQIGLLSNLKHINLTNNMLSGFIPHNLGNCTELTILALDYNQMSGEIPKQLSSLANLEIFGVGVNNFMTGTFPVWIGNLSSRFSRLSLSVNRFHGGIPPEIGRLFGLTFFQVSGNEFSGELPPSIYNISSLRFFSVTQNRLHGTISRDIGSKFPNLEFFGCGVNNFTGEIPASFANASRLASIELSRNNLKGIVPSNLGKLPFLYRINLEFNLLGNGETGDMNFISSLSNCTNLRVLSLLGNRFGGELPTAVANLSRKLEMITFGANKIHGSIPLGFGSFENLTYLSLESNRFTGTIPHDFGNLQKLNKLHLHGNAITGEIPSSLGNLTSLIELYLNRNKLRGSIPPHLGNCTRLLELNISNNNLTGNIPKEVVSLSSLSVILGLARNSFSGPLPGEVGRLVKLKELEVSGNKLSGPIPSSLSSCLSLEMLKIGGNRFEGPIPESLEALRGLEVIDFSHNNLSGKIPEFLGKLPFITKLDLSYNNLEGEVLNDGIFSNTTVISIVGNKKLCGGAASLNLPPCSVTARKSDKNLKLRLIIAVTVSSLVFFVLICSLTVCYILRKAKKNDDSTAFSSKEMQQISYQEINRSTNGFSAENLIGSGSFGSVYRGILGKSSAPTAIKVLNLEQRGASKSFMDECAILKCVRHRNLLKIITVCSSFDHFGREFKCLITEFMVNGSLDAWLHSRSAFGSNAFSIMQRLNIAIDVASALDYLHNHSHAAIIHCDLKPSNVLLDEDLTAHVADFGLSKFLLEAPNTPLGDRTLSLQLKGSIGYIPPEYGASAQISTLGDVYSFGILVLELFTGKRPTAEMFNNGLSIHTYVAIALPQHVMDVVDPSLILENEKGRETQESGDTIRENLADLQHFRSSEIECLVSVLKIGVSCSMSEPRDRTPMGNVVNHLNSIRDQIRRAT